MNNIFTNKIASPNIFTSKISMGFNHVTAPLDFNIQKMPQHSNIGYYLYVYILQHFTTFTPSRKVTKRVYTRSELSPLDFLWFGP